MLEARILGAEQFRMLAAKVRAEDTKGLGRAMGAGLKKAVQPVERSIRAEYGKLPTSGGYASAFSRSLRFRTNLRTAARSASFRLTTFADGTHERRDIDAVEAGRLRHPVYGRSRRIRSGRRAGTMISNPWAVTRIVGGYHKRGTDDAIDQAERQMSAVLADLSKRIVS